MLTGFRVVRVVCGAELETEYELAPYLFPLSLALACVISVGLLGLMVSESSQPVQHTHNGPLSLSLSRFAHACCDCCSRLIAFFRG
jgi:hypothetical protein